MRLFYNRNAIEKHALGNNQCIQEHKTIKVNEKKVNDQGKVQKNIAVIDYTIVGQ